MTPKVRVSLGAREPEKTWAGMIAGATTAAAAD
jgi:hypothetical protein